MITGAYEVFEVESNADAAFLYFFFLHVDEFKGLRPWYAGLRKVVRPDTFLSIKLGLPPMVEQKAIASFLDQETAKIDALIEEQRRLIELLKEKRQAVISHAVTKGLDLVASMKHSGVGWIGLVPSSWQIIRIKRTFEAVDYGISEALDAADGFGVLRMGNIQDGRVLLEDLKYVSEVQSELLLQNGDLLYNRTNSLDQIGKVGMFEGANAPITFASYLVRLRLTQDNVPRYFSYLLNAEGLLGYVRTSAFVAIGQCNLNPSRYGEIYVAVPPRAEQEQITIYLDTRLAEFRMLADCALRAITLLQERRSALISAAVTGKIDVRNYAPSDIAAPEEAYEPA